MRGMNTLAMAALIVAVAAAVLSGMATLDRRAGYYPDANEVRAQAFILVDENGVERASLRSEARGPVLELSSKFGAIRIGAAKSDSDALFICLQRLQGQKEAVVLKLSPSGLATMTMAGSQSGRIAVIADGDSTSLNVVGQDGEHGVYIGAPSTDGGGQVALDHVAGRTLRIRPTEDGVRFVTEKSMQFGPNAQLSDFTMRLNGDTLHMSHREGADVWKQGRFFAESRPGEPKGGERK